MRRVAVETAAQACPLPPNPVRERRAPFVHAERQVVLERVDASRRDVRIGRQIGRGVEADRGIAALVPAERVVVIERIDARGRDVLVGREIAGGVEQRVRITPLAPAEDLEVLVGIDAGGRDVGIVPQVIDRVEAVDGPVGQERRGGGAFGARPSPAPNAA